MTSGVGIDLDRALHQKNIYVVVAIRSRRNTMQFHFTEDKEYMALFLFEMLEVTASIISIDYWKLGVLVAQRLPEVTI